MDNAVRPISIHALREEGDLRRHRLPQTAANHFYPRPPRGGRRSSSKGNGKACKFLSTPSARRATVRQSRLSGSHQISIHALREEGDTSTRSMTTSTSYFYPRPPRGGRHRRSGKKTIQKHFYPRPPRGGRQSGRAGNNPDKRFLSTPSARRATHLTMLLSSENHISIHALREEGDKDTEGQKQQMNIFLSTPSARRATSSKKPR